MTSLVVRGERPPEIEEFLKRRHELGQDRFDEVWDGTYHMAPAPEYRHGDVGNQLAEILGPYRRRAGLFGTTAFNLGEPDDYRVPDGGYHRQQARVYVPTAAIVIEIVSPGDETFTKFGFYAAHGVDEICTADPRTRELRWWRLDGSDYAETDSSELLGVTVAEVAAQLDWPG